MGFIARIKGEEPSLLKQSFHKIKTGGDIGESGEWLINYALNNHNLPGKLRTFINVYVPLKGRRGQSESEIDILMVHTKGLYVVESKNYSGWIFGSVDQMQWTQSFKGGHKEHFYNPIKQNQTHIITLADALGLPIADIHSFIVFSERCELKNVPNNCDDYVICRRPYLLRAMKRDLKRRTKIFNEADFDRICSIVEGMKKTADKTNRHIDELCGYKSGNTCPWCGNKLVRRQSRYGEFIGCSAYPRCKFKRKLNE